MSAFIGATVTYQKHLKAEALSIHRNLTPLWRRRYGGHVVNGRRTEGKRLALLEAPGAAGITLRDVLSERTCPEDRMLALIPGDPRLARILAQLKPEEQAVMLALGLNGVVTWAEAAEYAGADDPPVFGERVRRKVLRLAAEQRRRDVLRRPGPPSDLRRPGQKGEQEGAST
ncbi:hypothetical protein ACNPQM_37495 [Streptomyces sp. NPDC056231]|uniref:hypothetical protein n=1 Tax=Streptomyces sp. NPDC056231 TaxID=3345755 RepID=UPI003AAF8840